MALSAVWAVPLLFVLVTGAPHRGVYFACYDAADKGMSYVGLESVAKGGKHCVKASINGSKFCRNRDQSRKEPWCSTDEQEGIESCDVQKCRGISITLDSVLLTSSSVARYGKGNLSADLAIDGKLGNKVNDCFLSLRTGTTSWWMAELSRETLVTSVGFQLLLANQDNSDHRMTDIRVEVGVLETSDKSDKRFFLCGRVWRYNGSSSNIIYRSCNSTGISGRYVRITSSPNEKGKSPLYLCEVQINSVCRFREEDSSGVQKLFNTTEIGMRMYAQCSNGYWPRHKQQLNCLDSGYWESPDCKKVANLKWSDVGAEAQLQPDVLELNKRLLSETHAIDGHIPANSGRGTGLYQCASTASETGERRLLITLQSEYLVISVKLYLRGNEGGLNRQAWQNGMQVFVFQKNGTRHQCGGDYNYATGGQFPVFGCDVGIVSISILLQLTKGPHPLQVCEVEVSAVTECGNPPSVTNANWSSEEKALNTEVIYRCKEGYLPSSPQSIQCLSNGSWSQPNPLCDRSCGNSSARFAHASTAVSNSANTKYGGKVQYACDLGYEVDGPPFLLCNSAGIWEGSINCKAITCIGLPSLRNGVVKGNLTTVVFSCYLGYRLVNSRKATCMNKNEWHFNDGKPSCELMKCEQPKKPRNGAVKVSDLSVNRTLVYTCSEKYKLEGPPSRVCSVDPQSMIPYWKPQLDANPAVCREITCEVPKKPENGNVVARSFVVGSHVTYVCNPGYQILGQKKRFCTRSLVWSGLQPTCTATSCEDPSTPTNGYYVVKHLEPRKMIRYRCYIGYALNGTESSTCEQGVWLSPPPNCQIMRCSKPVVPETGSVEFNDTTANSTAVYRCNKGYFVEGGNISMCRPLVKGNGAAWDKRTCMPIQCRTPTAPSNGGFTGDVFHYNNTIRFRCDKGYTLMGNSGFQCNSKGNWVTLARMLGNSFPTCKPKECGPPDKIEHGQVSGENFYFPERVNFTCDSGFCLSGPRSSQCTDKGSWSPSTPKCIPVMCHALPALSHGTVRTSSSNLTVGMVATYACNRGYDLNGKANMNTYTRKCIQTHTISDCDGEWTEDIPQCIAKKCEVPKSPTNGSVHGTVFIYPNNITFRCQAGYVIVGDTEFHCNYEGKWISDRATTFPICKPKFCGEPPNLVSGTVSGRNYHYPSRVTYTCNEGFCINGTSSAICLDNGSWSLDFRDCKRVWCSNLSNPKNGVVIPRGKRRAGEFSKYKCDRGYVLTGIAVRSCVQSEKARDCLGKWLHSAPTCKPIECNRVDSNSFPNGTVSGDKLYYPEVLSFKCNSGHKLQNGGPHWQCSENGTWIDKSSNRKGTFPRCEPIFCGPPTAFQHGIVKGNSFHFPANVKFACEPRFCLQGPTESQCTENGKWSSVTPNCSPVLCADLYPPVHGALKIDSSTKTVGLVATYTCNPGYELNAEADRKEYNRICKQSQRTTECAGQWTGDIPECIAKQCNDPIIPRNGTVIGKKFTYPNNITYQCVSGFDIVGEAEFRCGYKGLWVSVASPRGKPTFPSCKAKFCGEPPKVDKSEKIGSNYHFPGKVSYTCNKGFCIIGTQVTSCLATGAWSQELGKCKRVKCEILDHPMNGTVYRPKKSWMGQISNYTCDQGFVLNGHPSTTCKQSADQGECSGFWSNSAPVCNPINCPKVEAANFINGSVNSTKFYYPEVVQFQCISGHRLQGGGPNWQCRYDGIWIDKATNKSDPFPTCEPKNCNKPVIPKNCNIAGTYFQYPGVVHFTRHHGHCVEGATEIKCTSSGNWSDGSPNCKPIRCGTKIDPPYGKILATSGWPQKGIFVGDRIGYKCDSGYDLYMNRKLLKYRRTCKQPDSITDCRGRWSGNGPCCIPRSCPDPHTSNFQNGTIVGRAFFYPELIRLDCFVGHELSGDGPFFQCSNTGDWTVITGMPVDRQLGNETRIVEELKRIKECLNNDKIVTQPQTTNVPVFPTCEPKNCGKPLTNDNCTSTGNYFQYPGVVNIRGEHGFCVDGAIQLECNASGVWSSKPPKCKRVRCPALQTPSHGILEQSSEERYVDDTVNYTCQRGYDLNMDRSVPLVTRKCSQPTNISQCNGAWNGVAPCCTPRSCPDPQESRFQNGSIKGKAYFYPETIELRCISGHELVGGGPFFYCNDGGNWVPIEKLPNDTQNEIEQRRERERREAFECLGTREIVTKSPGTKLPTFPTCEPKNCLKPKVNENCRSKGNYYQVPGVVHFDRDPGYCVVGEVNISCTDDGVWSHVSPTCKRIRCPALVTPIHGFLNYSNGHREVGDMAIYTCQNGYDLNMDSSLQNFTRQCKQPSNIHQCIGQWEKSQPCCIPRSCHDPNKPKFRNGTIKGRAYFFPETIRLNCITGHELIGGEPLFQCNRIGQWVPIEKLPNDNQNEIEQRRDREKKHALECMGTRKIDTKNSQTMVPKFPTCEPKYCHKPKVSDKCVSTGKYFQFGGIVKFNREPHYCVVGSNVTECTSEGVWSHVSPTCKRIQCPSLVPPRNSEIALISPKRYVGDRAVYTCKRGYDIYVDKTRLLEHKRNCTQDPNIQKCDGFWTNLEPCCIPRPCPDPHNSDFDKGTIVGRHYFFPERISLICNIGHKLTRYGQNYQCSETGSWEHISNPLEFDGEFIQSRVESEFQNLLGCLNRRKMPPNISSASLPTCKPVICGKPDKPRNGQVVYVGNCTHYPCIVTFKCDTSYYMKGSDWTQCNASGVWSHESPKCKRVKCPLLKHSSCWYLDSQPSGYVDGKDICVIPHPGHFLLSAIKIRCKTFPNKRKAVGYWHPPIPICRAKDCGSPPAIETGTVEVNTTMYLSKIYYRCNEGYEIKDGDIIRKCLTTGKWSGVHPRCHHVCADDETNSSPAQTCSVKSGKREFSCLERSQCASDYTPVCASDTNSYNNRCLMKVAGCDRDGRNDTTEVARQGQCSFGGVCLDPRPEPPPGEKCRGFLYRYYHNGESGACERYVHGNCFVGHNKFYTIDDCEETCVKSNPCFLDMDLGACGLSQERFYYNIAHERCVKFTYSGCFGNENNFPSKEKCEMKCNGTRIIPTVVTEAPEDCCQAVLKKRCKAELVLDLGAPTLREFSNRLRVTVRIAPKNLKGKTVNKYRQVTTLFVPRQDSSVDGCSTKCPKLSSDLKYLALVREVRLDELVLSADKYQFIPYSSGEKKRLMADLKKCKK